DDEWFMASSSKKNLVEERICQECEAPLEEGQEKYCNVAKNNGNPS
ncbi:7523_t:CDS:1, partial [Rhizophagus irregularis]